MNVTNLGAQPGSHTWDPATWEDIRSAMRDVVARVAQCRKVLPRVIVPVDTVTINNDAIEPGRQDNPQAPGVNRNETIPLVELFAEFRLSREQIEREPTTHEGRGIAIHTARLMAEAEDWILIHGHPPPGSGLDMRPKKQPEHILWEKSPGITETVDRGDDGWREKIVSGIATATGELQQDGRYGPFAALLPPQVHADAKSPIGSSTRTALDLIDSDVVIGAPVRALGGTQEQSVLVVAMGGNEVDLITTGDEYQITPVRIDTEGFQVFRVNHRFALRLKVTDAVRKVVFAQ